MTVPEKLSALRHEMRESQLDAYVVPTTDPHQSEYPAPRWAAREWLSGFTGSAGTLVVTEQEAKLWTDGRYYLQATDELGETGIELMRDRLPETPSIEEWLGKTLLEGQCVGLDGRVNSVRTVERMEGKLADHELRLLTDEDLIHKIWAERPARPRRPVFWLDEKYSGESAADRLGRMTDWMREHRLDYYLVSALDEIAWLLNLRGADVDFNPVVVAHLVVGVKGDHVLFTEERPGLLEEPSPSRNSTGLSPRTRPNIDLAPYDKLSSYLRRINGLNCDIGLDPATTSHRLYGYAGGDKTSRLTSPIVGWKARKNETEIEHISEAMRHDAVALLRLRRWLDTALEVGVNEHEIAEKLHEFRAENELFVSDSFPAIVGYRGNGAIIHYRANAETSATVKSEGLLLLDSGGQYRNGTTDITRTFALDTPTAEQIYHATLVLQGHLNLAQARFPKGTTGVQLDTLARQPLWQAGLNYAHGTGHGVGFFLNVHEGPAGISANPKAASAREPLAAGMVLSNEPGYYREGEYGIRIENLVLAVPADPDGFLEFATLSLFPYDRQLIDAERLSQEQRNWIDAYHERVLTEVGPLLKDDELAWLTEACRPL